MSSNYILCLKQLNIIAVYMSAKAVTVRIESTGLRESCYPLGQLLNGDFVSKSEGIPSYWM